MKNEKGVTLSSLVITIIVIFILASISINYGLESITESKNKLLVAELQMVEQAVAEQFIQAYQVGLTEELYTSTETNKPSIFIGTLIPFSNLNTYNPEGITYKRKLQDGETESQVPYSEFYYKLEPDDLEKLNIQSSNENEGAYKYTYIVNYSTGEVYNYTKKKTSGEDATALYFAGKSGAADSINILEKPVDNTSFND